MSASPRPRRSRDVTGRDGHSCGVRIVATTSADLGGPVPVDDAHRCNTVDDDRACDQSKFAAPGTRSASEASTSAWRMDSTSGDGICFPLCSVPAYDLDGVIDADHDQHHAEAAFADGFQCTAAVSAALNAAHHRRGRHSAPVHVRAGDALPRRLRAGRRHLRRRRQPRRPALRGALRELRAVLNASDK